MNKPVSMLQFIISAIAVVSVVVGVALWFVNSSRAEAALAVEHYQDVVNEKLDRIQCDVKEVKSAVADLNGQTKQLEIKIIKLEKN